MRYLLPILLLGAAACLSSERKRSAAAEFVRGEIVSLRADMAEGDVEGRALADGSIVFVDAYQAGDLESVAGGVASLRELLPIYERTLVARGKAAEEVAEATRVWRALILAIELSLPEEES